METNNGKVMMGFLWRLAERFGAQLISFIVSIILARLLTPEAYGKVALVMVFITILQVFVDSGMGNALIQKKDADDIDFSSVFYFNLVTCMALYVLLFIFAPYIAHFYKNQMDLVPFIRTIGLIIIISGLKNVQQAYVSRNMLFKRFFYSTLGGTIISAIVGIWLAYLGFGTWALIAQQMTNMTIDTIILWCTVKWRPKRLFSWSRLKILLNYGWKLLVSSLIDTIDNNIRSIIIGKAYSASDLAYYDKGKQFPFIIIANVNTAIDSVLLPVMSQEQDHIQKVKAITRRAIKIGTYVIAPLMVGLAVIAEPLIQVLLTDKWMFCVPYLRVFSIAYLIWPIHTANLNAIRALGRSDIFLKLEIVKKAVGLILLMISIKYGALAIAFSMLFSGILGQFINSWPNKKLLNYGYFEQLKDIIPNLVLAIIMGVVVMLVGIINIPVYWLLMVQIITGIFIYLVTSILFKNESFVYLINTIKSIKR